MVEVRVYTVRGLYSTLISSWIYYVRNIYCIYYVYSKPVSQEMVDESFKNKIKAKK